MKDTIHLDPNNVPNMLKRGYSGRKFQLHVAESVNISNTQWDGGSRSTYTAVNLETGQSSPMTDPRPWPDNMAPWGDVDIKPNHAVIEHVIFCGKDLGLRITVRPENATKLLPDTTADELTADELVILYATRAYKASYAGMDRRQMVANDGHKLTVDQWEAAKARLIAGKYLNRAGAITTKGKNAAPTRI
jgi:hypothetical protein